MTEVLVTQADRDLWRTMLGLPEANRARRSQGLPTVEPLELLANHRIAGQAELADQIAWRGGEPPKDGSTFYGHSWRPYRWKAYSPKSEQFRHGIKGRWQSMNEFAGWDNAQAPDEWAADAQIDARRQALSAAPFKGGIA